jgi:hypothetical protein
MQWRMGEMSTARRTPARSSRLALMRSLTVISLGTAIAVLGIAVTPAGAATPCAKKILGEWLDHGRIEGRYPLRCYEQAIDAIPPEILDYSNAEEVIRQAFHTAGGRGLALHKGARARARESQQEASRTLDTSAPTAFPLPLLALTGVSLALLAAGAVGYVSRRRRAQVDEQVSDEDRLD